MIGDVTYSELSGRRRTPAGKRWVKYGGEDDFDSEAFFEQSQREDDEEGGISSFAIFFGAPEPTVDGYLDYLREDAEPERVGEEDVRGIPTTHYRSELNMRNRIEASLEAEGWKSANIELYLEQMEETRLVIDVWVDSEARARRVVTTDGALGAEEGWVTTTEYFDFGLEVDIQAPPAAEVLESEELERIMEKKMEEEQEDSAESSCLH